MRVLPPRCSGLYRRTTRRRRQDGPDAISSQLADHADHQAKRHAETRVRSTFGRADQGDPVALGRRAPRLRRGAHAARIERPARTCPPAVGLDALAPVDGEGVLQAARAVWDERGMGPRRRAQLPQDSGDAPHALTWLALTAHRRARLTATVACDAHGLAADV